VTDVSALHELLLVPGNLDLNAVARFLTTVLDADGSLVMVVDSTGKELYVGAADPPGEPADSALKIPVGFGVTGLVALNGHAVTLVDDSPRNVAHRGLLRLTEGETVSRLCVPGHGLSSTIVAVMSVHRHGSRAFTEVDLHRAQIYADLVGLRLYAQGLLGVAEQHQTLRDRLIAQAISAQEAERRRIAGDLHDGVTQALASLAFHLSAAEVGLGGMAIDDRRVVEVLSDVRQARRLAGLAYDDTRTAITGLHSLLLEDLGLSAALESLSQTIPQIEVEFRSDDADHIGEVPDHCAAVLYRIAQEAINNIVKHADARHVVLSLRRVGEAIVLGVADDGVGFDVASVRATSADEMGEHFGLSSIAERCALIGATLRIDSVEGRGTAVFVEVPV
jgi:signal transduction histidine kinase